MSFAQKPILVLLPSLLLLLVTYSGWAQEQDVEALKTEQARAVCIYFLDGYLCLNSEQTAALDELIQQHWPEQSVDNLAYFIYNGYTLGRNYFDNLPSEKLAEILDESQKKIFDNLSTDSLSLSNQLNIEGNDWESEEDPITPFLRVASELEVQRLNQLLDLSDKQKMRLTIVAKGAGKEVVDKRKTLFEGENLNQLISKPGIFRYLMEPPLFQLTKTKIWNRSIAQTLDDKQLEIYRSDLRARYHRSLMAASFSFVIGYQDSDAPFDFDEFVALSDLIVNKVKEKIEADDLTLQPSLYFESFDLARNLKEEDFTGVLSGEKLEQIVSILTAIQERDEMNEQNEDEELDDSDEGPN